MSDELDRMSAILITKLLSGLKSITVIVLDRILHFVYKPITIVDL